TMERNRTAPCTPHGCRMLALLLLGRGPELVMLVRVRAVFREHEREDVPQLVAILDQRAEWRHRTDDVFPALAHVAGFLQLVAAQGHEAEPRVVVAAIEPGV